LRISFSFFANTQPIEADLERPCNRVGRVFAAL
jgi:hypothetical protein